MIYISLTTVPARMQEWESLKLNLLSLVNQKTQKEFKVILNIPYMYKNKNEPYIISDELNTFVAEYSRLSINRVEEDSGPIVKILGVLNVSSNPDDTLIICDDDHVYNEGMLEYHIKKMEQYPNSAIAFRGDIPVEKREWIDDDGVKKYTLRPTHFLFPVKNDLQLIIPGHWHSVGYKRSFFKEDFFDKDFLTGSVNDDVLMGYYCKKHQIDVRCVKWDGESDWRAVNQLGRACYSFPIDYSLPYPNSGFYEFRQVNNDSQGRIDPHISKVIEDHDTIYIEKK